MQRRLLLMRDQVVALATQPNPLCSRERQEEQAEPDGCLHQ